jgi:quinol monooxygenase YgiN
VQAATRNDPGCIPYDLITCTDNPDLLVLVEAWTS